MPKSINQLATSRNVVALIVAALVLLSIVPLILPSYNVYVASRVVIFGLFATAYNIVFGYGGMHSFGHAAFFGVGSYTVAIGVSSFSASPVLLLVGSILLGAVLGAVFGLLSMRARGLYIFLLTLSLAQCVNAFVQYQVGITGGDNGITGIERPEAIASEPKFNWFCLVVAVVCMAGMRMFSISPVGKSIAGLRESALRTSATGYNASMICVIAFTVSGAFSGLSGAMFTYLQGSTSPESTGWLISANVMVYAIVGGAGYFLGPFLGAALLVSFQAYVSSMTDQWITILGVVYVIAALGLRNGALGRLAAAAAWLSRQRMRGATVDQPVGALAEIPVSSIPVDRPVDAGSPRDGGRA
jgi:branched-chain amino acid transport system permease protein